MNTIFTNNDYFFSIIIPAYNAEKFIITTLESVISQTYTSFEILITNDGSIDNTESKINDFIIKHPYLNIQVSSQLNKGIGNARNNAIFRAKGTFLAFLDADDIWYPDKLLAVHEILINNLEIDVLYHDELVVRNYNKKKSSKYGNINNPVYKNLLLHGNKLSTSATIVKTDKAILVSGFSEDLNYNSAEDYDFWLKLAKIQCKFFYLPKILGEYHRIDTSISLRILYHIDNSYNVISLHLRELIHESNYKDKILLQRFSKLDSFRFYTIARAFHNQNYFFESIKYYFKAINENIYWFKPYIGLLQSLFMLTITFFSKNFFKIE